MPTLLFTLEHGPGPAWDPDRSWRDQDLGPHFAFQQHLAERGLLVAAGPRPDEPGTGMMLIRAADEAEARHLATEVDGGVAGGLLTVTVRPWLVVNGDVVGTGEA